MYAHRRQSIFRGLNPRSNAGFTLIELIACIVILGIVAAIAVPVFLDLRRDARIATLKQIAGVIQTNAQAARQAWVVQGGGTSTSFNGMTLNTPPVTTWLSFLAIEDYPPEIIPEFEGLTDGQGMARLIGCADKTSAIPAGPTPCATGGRFGASANGSMIYRPFYDQLGLVNCTLVYWPSYGDPYAWGALGDNGTVITMKAVQISYSSC